MTDFDLFIVSLIINIGLIIQNRFQHALLVQARWMLSKCGKAIEAVADGKGEFYREGEKVHLREKKHALN